MRLRFGVVGTAYWAREIHLPGLLGASGVDVVGLWGRTPKAVEAIAMRRGLIAFSRFDDLLDAVEAVTMAVPPEAQATLAVRAAEAGKHLLVEKPLTRDPMTARAIVAAVEKNKVAALVFLLRRFVPEIAAIIETERRHAWTRAEIRVHSNAMATKSPYVDSVWRQELGAALWDIGPHVLSILTPMMGRVIGVEAQPERHGISTFRTVHDRGGVADISVTLHSTTEDVSNQYRFCSATRDIDFPRAEFSRIEVFSRAATALTEVVASNRRDHECGVALGADIVEILAAAERSAAQGSVVHGSASSGGNEPSVGERAPF
jgi:predicted dehydrogenase